MDATHPENTFLEITGNEYHAIERLSSHGVMDILQSPAHYQARRQKARPQTPAMRFGELVHLAILEPEKWAQHVQVQPDFGPLTYKANREQRDAWVANLKPNAFVVTAEEEEQILGMMDQVYVHKTAKQILSNGKAEQTLFFQADGVPCKMRADYLKANFVVDYKTCANATFKEFQKAAANFKYHIQASFYLLGMETLTQKNFEFIFVCQESSYPYAVAVYVAQERGFLEIGRKLVERGIQRYQRCVETNLWPGYPSDPIDLVLPNWAMNTED